VPRHQLKGREGCEKEERDGKGKGEMGREGKVRKDGAGGGEKVEKGKEGSTWIFVQGPRVPSHATGRPSSLYSANRCRPTVNTYWPVIHRRRRLLDTAAVATTTVTMETNSVLVIRIRAVFK